MKDFLYKNYTLLNDSVIIMAAIAAIISYKKFKNTNVKYFIYFLIYVALVDFLGGYKSFFSEYDTLKRFKEIIKGTFFDNNYWWFTLFWNIGSALFFSYYYYKLIVNHRFKSIIKVTCSLFLLMSFGLIIIDINRFSNAFINPINIFGAVLILMSISFYFIEILKSDKILGIVKSINFIISVAIFVWWLVVTPLIFYDIYFSSSDLEFVRLRRMVYLLSNIFMYTTFAIGLIVLKPEYD
ncbi:hypothetical protein ACFS5M_08820 [Lacinutrix iliipiscaria]|uniref:Uncharacterized protein n=1 Tax=Lacinutrix iliipiscaria TaxID=1230532 RepID=A0ABW5WNI4_9FLAO